MTAPKIYEATEVAAAKVKITALSGDRRAAQAYVDRITRSVWWAKHCPPNFNGTTPRKILIQETDDPAYGGGAICDDDLEFIWYGKPTPIVVLGHMPSYNHIPALADPWVILHELAHIWLYQVWHGRTFQLAYLALVKRYMGQACADALIAGMKETGIRHNYSLLSA